MKLHSVPTIVLHFHGFELSSLSTMHEQITSIVKEVTHKAATLVALYGGCVVVTYAVKVMMSVMLNAVVSGAITFATYSSLLVLTTPPALPFAAHSSTAPACERCASRCKTERLPLLSARELVPSAGLYLVPGERPSKKEDEDVLSSSSFRTSGQLPAVRRRLMARMRQGPPIVNVVRGETRRRADMALSDAKIRVGKAYMETNRATGKQTDVYMVRVDCGTSGDEKHMNPVVMWDVSATFDEFKRLESDLKKEIKHKRLRNLRVPHLSTGAVLFVQPELTQHVLNARRQRLQTFLDEIRTDKVMADLDAMRRFCQAF
ncbi:TPA: hypothetical protein N0F65_011654 [Lagenidium giganteum]|uniref:PX domain-containing protein n=1 Tax=Lagenidium giganteum TaxID=4803 RepID=A0AAV2ZBH5_9STRA|nr:TPA: hypothetical protein N0F65_011654 [Lagenidium giganteum]